MTVALAEALAAVAAEVGRGEDEFGLFRSKHEAIAIIREEYLELEREVFWPERRDKSIARQEQTQEAAQLAAMALRFVVEYGDPGIVEWLSQRNQTS